MHCRKALAILATFGLMGLLVGPVAPSVNARIWTSAAGNYRVTAEFVEARPNGTVLLKRPDGQMLEIKLEQLSQPDQMFIRQEMVKPKPRVAPVPKNIPDPPTDTPPLRATQETPKPDPPAETARKLKPVPAKAKEEEILVKLRQTDDSLERATTSAEKSAAAQKLIQLGLTLDDDDESYTALMEASRLAAAGGDAEAAMRALSLLGESYEIDVYDAKHKAFAEILLKTRDQIELRGLAGAMLSAVDEAVKLDNYDAALKLSRLAKGAAVKSKHDKLMERTGNRVQDVARFSAEFGRIKSALEILRENPADSAAHMKAASFYCFVKDDWPKGLSHLAKCGDETLMAIARDEAQSPEDVSAQVQLADRWYELGEKKTPHRQAARQRASHWYREALPQMFGPEKEVIQKRLEDLSRAVDKQGRPVPATVDLLALVSPERHAVMGQWTKTDDGLAAPQSSKCKIFIPYTVLGEYDLHISITPAASVEKQIFLGLLAGDHQFFLVLDGETGKCGLAELDRAWYNKNPTTINGPVLRPGRRNELIVSVRRSGLTASANGRIFMRYTGGYQRLRMNRKWGVPNTNVFFLLGWDKPYIVHAMQLKVISGEGKSTEEPQ